LNMAQVVKISLDEDLDLTLFVEKEYHVNGTSICALRSFSAHTGNQRAVCLQDSLSERSCR
jgi:hypothetical protein